MRQSDWKSRCILGASVGMLETKCNRTMLLLLASWLMQLISYYLICSLSILSKFLAEFPFKLYSPHFQTSRFFVERKKSSRYVLFTKYI